MKYILDRTYARELLEWAYEQNPGPWLEHSCNVALATEKIVVELINNGYDLNADIAYNAALLHDNSCYFSFPLNLKFLL